MDLLDGPPAGDGLRSAPELRAHLLRLAGLDHPGQSRADERGLPDAAVEVVAVEGPGGVVVRVVREQPRTPPPRRQCPEDTEQIIVDRDGDEDGTFAPALAALGLDRARGEVDVGPAE